MSGEGKFPFRSGWFGASQTGRPFPLYKSIRHGNNEGAGATAFNDWFFGSAAAVYNVSVSEVLLLSDTQTVLVDWSVSASESLSLSDAGDGSLGGISGSVSESFSLADAASATVDFSVSVSESMSLADAPSVTAAFAASVAEALQLNDGPTAVAVLNDAVAESLALADSQNGIVPGAGGPEIHQRGFMVNTGSMTVQ